MNARDIAINLGEPKDEAYEAALGSLDAKR